MKLADNASLGIVETKGLVGAVAAADAMVKAASVSLFRKHFPGSARVTLMCQGELSACEAAVYAGTREAEAVGELIGSTVIGRPDFGAEELCLGCIDAAMERKKARKAALAATRACAPGASAGEEGGGKPDRQSAEESGEQTGAAPSGAAEAEEIFRIGDAVARELASGELPEAASGPAEKETKVPPRKKKPKPGGTKR